MCSVLCPVIFIAVRRSTPALMRLRAALRRKSWGVRPVYALVLGSYFPSPSLPQVAFQIFRKFLNSKTRSVGFGKDLRSSRRAVAISSSGPASGIVSGSSFFMISRGSVISLQSLSIIVHVIFFAAPDRHPLKYKRSEEHTSELQSHS